MSLSLFQFLANSSYPRSTLYWFDHILDDGQDGPFLYVVFGLLESLFEVQILRQVES